MMNASVILLYHMFSVYRQVYRGFYDQKKVLKNHDYRGKQWITVLPRKPYAQPKNTTFSVALWRNYVNLL